MVAKKKDQVINPEPDPSALEQEMDDLDYSAGAAPTSTTTPEAPVVPEGTSPGAAPEVAEGEQPPPSPEVKVGEEEVPPVGEPPGEPTPIAGVKAGEEEPPKEPEAKVGEVKTPEQLLAETHASQVAHFQKLYEETKKRLEELEAKVSPPAEAKTEEVAPKPPTPEEIRRYYEPEMAKVVEEGYLSREFVEDYPNDVAQMLYHRDLLYNVSKELAELKKWAQGTIGQQRNQAAESHLNTIMDTVANKGTHFQPLKDPEVRKAFRDYLDRVNPMCNADNVEEVISQQYLAFNHQAVLAALSGGSAPSASTPGSPPSPSPAPAPKPNLAMGEHGGTRAGQPGSQKIDPFLAEMDALD